MTRRMGPALAGIGGACLLVVLVSGAGTGMAGGLVGVAAIGGVGWLVAARLQHRRPAIADAWTSGTARYRPAADHSPGSPAAVAIALNRVEARELGSSAAFGLGLGFCVMVVVLFAQVWARDFDGERAEVADLFPIYVHPLAGMVVLAAHRARTRSTRDATEEVMGVCPTSPGVRTTAHLLTAWLPTLTAAVFLGVFVLVLSTNVRFTYGDLGARQAATALGAVLLCAGATALGVALARWAPWGPAPVVAVLAVGVVSIRLATAGDRSTEPLRQLSTWLNDPPVASQLTAPHWAAHQVWIAALVAVVAALALAHDVRRAWAPVVVVGLAAVAAVGGVGATRPMETADVARITSMIDHPERHQRCIDAAGLPVCTYGSSTALGDHLAAEVRPVVASAPKGALSGWRIREGADLKVDELDPAVARRLGPDAQRLDGALPLRMGGHPHAAQGARFWTALAAVGAVPHGPDRPVVDLRGQARGVVALWLATRGTDARTATMMTSFSSSVSDIQAGNVRPWPDVCYAGPVPVRWGLSDLTAARHLMAAPEAGVTRTIHSSWAHLVDPGTTTAELLALLGLPPVPDRVERTRTAAGPC